MNSRKGCDGHNGYKENNVYNGHNVYKEKNEYKEHGRYTGGYTGGTRTR